MAVIVWYSILNFTMWYTFQVILWAVATMACADSRQLHQQALNRLISPKRVILLSLWKFVTHFHWQPHTLLHLHDQQRASQRIKYMSSDNGSYASLNVRDLGKNICLLFTEGHLVSTFSFARVEQFRVCHFGGASWRLSRQWFLSDRSHVKHLNVRSVRAIFLQYLVFVMARYRVAMSQTHRRLNGCLHRCRASWNVRCHPLSPVLCSRG